MSNLSTLPNCYLLFNSGVQYSCSNPFPNCTSPKGFDFITLWLVTQAIYSSCQNDTRIFQNTKSLTQETCERYSGGNHWKPYDSNQIWARLSSWKLPLFQLAALFPRPPLSFLVELFVIVHLMGDPISTISNLLRKFESCHHRAEYWRNKICNEGLLDGILREDEDVAQLWKGLAAITDSYDEWGEDSGERAKKFLLSRLLVPNSQLFLVSIADIEKKGQGFIPRLAPQDLKCPSEKVPGHMPTDIQRSRRRSLNQVPTYDSSTNHLRQRSRNCIRTRQKCRFGREPYHIHQHRSPEHSFLSSILLDHTRCVSEFHYRGISNSKSGTEYTETVQCSSRARTASQFNTAALERLPSK